MLRRPYPAQALTIMGVSDGTHAGLLLPLAECWPLLLRAEAACECYGNMQQPIEDWQRHSD
jgi:hypothetical protein